MSAAVKDTFQLRVRNAFHGKYQQVMRRSLQSVALWEAHRSLESRYSQLRPFQRKYALFATAVELLKTLDFLDYYQRQEVMFRTIASREPIPAEVAWKRMKTLERDIQSTVLPRVRHLLAGDRGGDDAGRTHDELCHALLQGMYDESRVGKKPAPCPPNWEFKHNNVFAIYRVYYRGVGPDPGVFPATPPKVVEVARGAAVPGAVPPGALPPAPAPRPPADAESQEPSADARRARLKEVREHTALLDSFAGLVPDDEIAVRKRALYELLPPVPCSVEDRGKKRKRRGRGRAVAALPMAPWPGVVPAPPAVPALPAVPAVPAAIEPGAGVEGVDAAAAEPAEAEDWERALAEEAAQSVVAEC